ncbi:MAG: general stress protein [Pseudolysinimonas sp.]
MTNPTSAPRPQDVLRVPTGDVLGTYDTYPEAQAIVDHLAKADFPVGQVSIVGNDLKSVERVTRKLSWSRAALEGALSGAWFGLFLGFLFTFVTPAFNIGLLVAAILIGAAFGLFFRLVTYAIGRRSRDFDSTKQVLASNYQVLVPADLADRAKQAIATPLPE